MISYDSILDLGLTFVAGLLFGLAIKKGATALILAIIGFVISSYLGLSFIPKISISYVVYKALSLTLTCFKEIQFGSVVVSLSIILLLLGLIVGLWKG